MRQFETAETEAVTAFYRSIDDPAAKAVLDHLIDHPEQRLDGAAIARQLGLERHRDVARATFLIGQIAAARGHKRPWNEAQLGYAMPEAQAALFRRARASS
ncbi:MAG: hypothetical protein H0U10_03905 [Chloroflexia bacterium]|nr:hypothetical protein [Chloroflexia bacterium]